MVWLVRVLEEVNYKGENPHAGLLRISLGITYGGTMDGKVLFSWFLIAFSFLYLTHVCWCEFPSPFLSLISILFYLFLVDRGYRSCFAPCLIDLYIMLCLSLTCIYLLLNSLGYRRWASCSNPERAF